MRFPTLRLLPVTIFVATLMLTVRVSDIMRGLGGGGGQPVTVSQLMAQDGTPAPVDDGGPAAAADGASGGAAPAAGGRAAPRGPGSEAVVDLTPGEIEVLQRLQERREELEERRRELDMREGLLQAAETRIDRKIAEMKDIQADIQDLLRQHDEQEEAQMQSLVKIYENMKPKEAARIFEELEMPVLLDVMERMSERRVAPILAQMDPMRARAVTTEMAHRRKMEVAADAAESAE